MSYKLPLSKDELVKLYISGKGIPEIARLCKCTNANIYVHLKNQDVIFRTPSEARRVFKLNETFFENIDCEEKAYILGFWYADGYNQQDRNRISLQIINSDEEILHKIKKLMQTDIPLGYCANNVRLTLTSKKLSKDLAKAGCFQNKSFTLTFPIDTILSEDLVHHFIRGYFDGDGCISVNTNKGSYQLAIEGTITFIKVLQQILINNCGVSKTKLVTTNKYKDKPYTRIIYSGRKNVLKILNYLYKDSTIYLSRKYIKYKSIPVR